MADIYLERHLISKTPLSELPENWHGKPFVEIIFNLCQKVLKSNPDQEWLRNGQTGQYLLFKDIEAKCIKAAKILSSNGLKKGDTVHIDLPNCVEFHVTVFAVWLLGGITSLADPSLRQNVLLEQIKDVNAAFAICHSNHLLNTSSSMIQIITLEDVFESRLVMTNDVRLDFSTAKSVMHETLVIFWSSGTTGRPKGIAHGINFFLRCLVKSDFPPATLLQTVQDFKNLLSMAHLSSSYT